MVLTDLSSKSISKIFKILQPRDFSSIDHLRQTNSKCNEIAVVEKEPLMIENVTLELRCETFEQKYRLQASAMVNNSATLFLHEGNFLKVPELTSRLPSLYKKVTKRIRSIERLDLFGFTITDENVKQCQQLMKSEMKIVKSIRFFRCSLKMERESFHSILNVMNLEHFTLAGTAVDFEPDNSVFWNMKSAHYWGGNLTLLTNELLEHWCENPPRRFCCDTKTNFTIPAVVKLIEVLLKKATPSIKRNIGLGQLEATEEDLRILSNYIQQIKIVSWIKKNRYIAYTNNLWFSFEVKEKSPRK